MNQHIILPTNFTPRSSITLLNGIVIAPFKRAGIKDGNSKSFTDCLTISNYKNLEDLKRWVMFHAFIFDSYETVSQFEESRSEKLDFSLNQRPMTFGDYDDVLPRVFFSDNINKLNKVKYADLYNGFVTEYSDISDLVTNYLTRFHQVQNLTLSITDTSYWQLMVYYSIIDGLIGPAPNCKASSTCEECGRSNVQHHSISSVQWINQRLEKLIPNNASAQNGYGEIIFAVREHIRHKTVHESFVPVAKRFLMNKESDARVISYDLKKSIVEFQQDHTALDSLVLLLKDVSRYLLLERIFNLGIFPVPQPLLLKSWNLTRNG